LKGLAKEEGESWKYNPSKEWVECEIGQNTTTMKTTKRKLGNVVISIKLNL
jgi:hypothetical protein